MGARTAPERCTARSSMIHSGRFLATTATFSIPSMVRSPPETPSFSRPVLSFSIVSATSAVGKARYLPSSLPASMSGRCSLSRFSSRQSNNRLGSVIVIVWIKLGKKRGTNKPAEPALQNGHLFGFVLIILPFGQFEDAAFLVVDKAVIIVAMGICPGLECRQISSGSEDPLVVGIEHPIF